VGVRGRTHQAALIVKNLLLPDTCGGHQIGANVRHRRDRKGKTIPLITLIKLIWH